MKLVRRYSRHLEARAAAEDGVGRVIWSRFYGGLWWAPLIAAAAVDQTIGWGSARLPAFGVAFAAFVIGVIYVTFVFVRADVHEANNRPTGYRD